MLQKKIAAIAFCVGCLIPMHLGAVRFAIIAFDNQSTCPMMLEQRNHEEPAARYQFEPRRVTLCSPLLHLGCGFPSLFLHNPRQKQPAAVYFDERYIPQSDIQLHLGRQCIRAEDLLHKALNPESTYPLVLGTTPEGAMFLKPYAEYESRVNENFPICFYPPS